MVLLRRGLYLLLGGVIKLVLAGTAEALLDARVRPQANHGGQQLWRIGLSVLHAAHNITHHLSIRLLKENTQRLPISAKRRLLNTGSLMQNSMLCFLKKAIWN